MFVFADYFHVIRSSYNMGKLAGDYGLADLLTEPRIVCQIRNAGAYILYASVRVCVYCAAQEVPVKIQRLCT